MKKSYNLLPRSCDNNNQQQQEAIRNVKVKLFLSFFVSLVFVSSAFSSLIISAASTNELSQAEDLL